MPSYEIGYFGTFTADYTYKSSKLLRMKIDNYGKKGTIELKGTAIFAASIFERIVMCFIFTHTD